MTQHRAMLFAAGATLAILAGQTGVAQAQSPSAPGGAQAAGAKVNEIEEVVVQARRTEESQQDVPIAVSTVTEERLTTAAVTTVADIQRLVPSLRVTQGATGQLDFSLRGAFLGFGVDPSVVSYIDEVPTDPKVLVYGVYDLNSVEVLKGPQGTLFGRNSTGGAVLFTSKRPNTSESGGYLRAHYGNLDDRLLEAGFTAPLSDTFAIRVAGKVQRRDGTLHSVTAPGLQYDNRHSNALRASALWTPTDNIENYTLISHYWVRERRAPQRDLTLVGGCTGPTTPVTSCIYQPPFNAILGTDNLRFWFDREIAIRGTDGTVNSHPNPDNVAQDAITNKFTIDLGAVSLKNISYYGDLTIDLGKDYDGTPARVIEAFRHDETKTFYTETQLYGQLFDDRLDWRVGVVYNRDKANSDGVQIVFPFPVSVSTPRQTLTDTVYKSTAIFGQATYDLSALTEGLSVTAGYRYTWDERKVATQAFAGAPTPVCALQTLPVPAAGPSPFPATDLASCTRRLQLSYDDDNYTFTVDWKPTDQILVYASTRKGYKTGSFNISAIDPAIAQYAPEVVKDVEFGLKADWSLGSIPFRTNIALYRSKYTNIQTSFTVVDTVTGAVTPVTLNADPVTGRPSKATIKGFEVELTAKPTSWLVLTSFYSRIDGEYTQFINLSPRRDLAGEKIAGVTPKSYGLSAQLDLPVSGPFDELQLTGSYFWRGKNTTNSLSTTTALPARSTSSVDARLALTNVFDSGADLAIYGRNLGDRESCTTNPIVGGLITTQCSEGKTYGLELRYRFGAERH